jgi:SpoVK/Ycf46/Vps4 family AAA+-type ATPase
MEVGMERAKKNWEFFFVNDTPRRSLSDLILSENCRKHVDELIEEQLRSSSLRAYGLEPRHRVLLVGPPGTGKASLAEAIANDLALPLLAVRYEAMIGSSIGETAARLTHAFDRATEPCVLFFDDCDRLGVRGTVSDGAGLVNWIASSLLMRVEQLPSYVFVVAATRTMQSLGHSICSKFQIFLTMPEPGQKELAEYFDKFLASFEPRPNISGAEIAKRLGDICYAYAENFTLDVRRHHILAGRGSSLEDVIKSRLDVWDWWAW